MAQLSSERKRFLEKYTLQYMEHLPEVHDYLVGRGIDLEYARAVGLGVVRNPPPQHAMREGDLAIPYFTDFGPVNMRFRCMKDHNCKELGHGKYHTPKGWGVNLYGVQQIARADDWIAVTEGEIDAITLQQVGIPAIGIPGSQNWEDHWPNVFDDFSAVHLFTDGDSAGQKMWDLWSDQLTRNSSCSIVRVKMPDGEDVNSFFLRHGAEALRVKVRKA